MIICGSIYLYLTLPRLAWGFTGVSTDLNRSTGKPCRTERLSKFVSRSVRRCTVPGMWKKKRERERSSFIHVQLSRCQEFCQASHCSVNLVPVKRSVSVSLVKHYCQATGGRGERGKEGERGRGSLHPSIIKQTWPLTKKRAGGKQSKTEKSQGGREREQG